MAFTESIDIAGPAGILEAVLMTPSEPPRSTALLCHAHPLHGGMMHFKLLYRVAKVLQGHRAAVLRFNFRGVGRSEGEHDGGRGELDDVRAALDELTARFPDVPVLLGGFSFGAVMALAAARDDRRVSALLALGLPLAALGDLDFVRALAPPILFVQGEADPFGDGPAITRFVDELPGRPRLVVVPKADHFFSDRLSELESAVASWLESLEPGAGSG